MEATTSPTSSGGSERSSSARSAGSWRSSGSPRFVPTWSSSTSSSDSRICCNPDPANFAAELAHRLFNYIEPDTGRPTRTLLLSATPYRMYTTADEVDGDHYEDFLSTCSFLFQDDARVDAPAGSVRRPPRRAHLRRVARRAEAICADIGVGPAGGDGPDRAARRHPRPRRDAATNTTPRSRSKPDDLRSYLRLGDLAEAVEHHEPTEYWKAGPYLVNFMERYKLKEALDRAAAEGSCRTASDLARAGSAELGRHRVLRVYRSPERPAPLAPRRSRPPPGVRIAVDAAVAPLLRRRIGLRVRRGARPSPSA